VKSERNILIAFILNLAFSIFEFIGGAVTGSVAIISDAVHDIGDAVSIGVSYFLEKKSRKKPDGVYTYGYARYSVVGSVVTTLILLFGSAAVIYNAVLRIFDPVEINYKGMIIFAVIGVIVNLAAAMVTKEGDSLNQKAVNLHMLEDVLGWIVVLVGGVIMNFTDIRMIDPVMSLGVALFILVNAVKNLKEVLDVFLEKAPHGIDVAELQKHITAIDGVAGVHHVHIWSIDGQNSFATMHIVTSDNTHKIKDRVKEELRKHGIGHATLELEEIGEHCHDDHCHTPITRTHGHHHHHHH